MDEKLNSKNPFATPGPEPDHSKPAPDDWLARLLPDAKATFRRWESWRLIYCAVCILATFGFLLLFDKFPATLFPDPPPAQRLNSWIEFVVAGIIANIFFFAGPVVDTYVSWLGLKTRWVGIGLLVLGTAFTVFAAFLAISGFLN